MRSVKNSWGVLLKAGNLAVLPAAASSPPLSSLARYLIRDVSTTSGKTRNAEVIAAEVLERRLLLRRQAASGVAAREAFELSSESLARIWDNDLDALYDDL